MTYDIKITPAVAADIAARQVHDPPYGRITEPGIYPLTASEAASLRDDAKYHSDTEGPGALLSIGQRNAYRYLARQIEKVVPADELAKVEPIVLRAHDEVLDEIKLVPLGTLPRHTPTPPSPIEPPVEFIEVVLAPEQVKRVDDRPSSPGPVKIETLDKGDRFKLDGIEYEFDEVGRPGTPHPYAFANRIGMGNRPRSFPIGTKVMKS
jgi:hypothetical protein